MDRNQLLNDSEAAMIYALDGRQAKTWTALPGIVQSVDFSAMTCQVQPAIQGVYTDDNGAQSYVNLPLLVDVPICFPSAGGFSLTLPMAANDEVLIIIASRCIDAWWQQGGVQPPMEMRMHDLSDGFAIPGPRSQPRVISDISTTNAQLRNDAGTVYMEITPAGAINLKAPAGVTVTGNLNVTGAIVATEEVTAMSTIPLSTHTHPVTTAPGETGPPAP